MLPVDIHSPYFVCGDVERIANIIDDAIQSLESLASLDLVALKVQLQSEPTSSTTAELLESVDLLLQTTTSVGPSFPGGLSGPLRQAAETLLVRLRGQPAMGSDQKVPNPNLCSLLNIFNQLRSVIESRDIGNWGDGGGPDGARVQEDTLKAPVMNAKEENQAIKSMHRDREHENRDVTLSVEQQEKVVRLEVPERASEEEFRRSQLESSSMCSADRDSSSYLAAELEEKLARLRAPILETEEEAQIRLDLVRLHQDLARTNREEARLRASISEVKLKLAEQQGFSDYLDKRLAMLDEVNSLPTPPEFVDRDAEAALCVQTYVRAYLVRKHHFESLTPPTKSTASVKKPAKR